MLMCLRFSWLSAVTIHIFAGLWYGIACVNKSLLKDDVCKKDSWAASQGSNNDRGKCTFIKYHTRYRLEDSIGFPDLYSVCILVGNYHYFCGVSLKRDYWTHFGLTFPSSWFLKR